MKPLANHRCDPLVHERTGGAFVVPQIDSANGPAVFRTQELFPDQTGHVAESWCVLVKRGANLLGGNASRQLESGNDMLSMGQLFGNEWLSVNGTKGLLISGTNQDRHNSWSHCVNDFQDWQTGFSLHNDRATVGSPS